jgi:hypothetical protein
MNSRDCGEVWAWIGIVLFGALAVAMPAIFLHLLMLYGG